MTVDVRPQLAKVLACLPTYNERENLPLVISRIRTAAPHVDIVVLDDNSPDGTGAVADEIAARDSQVKVLHRPRKEGLGPAYLAGFAWADQQGYDAVVEIDADGSHPPEQLPALLAAAEHADVVIGSRWVPGGSVHRWPVHRRALSRGANTYARYALGIPVRDSTAGYRVYRMSALRTMDTHDVASQGYCFQVDLTLRALDRGLVVREVPIAFVERENGASKMSRGIVLEAAASVARWAVQRRAARCGNVWGPKRVRTDENISHRRIVPH